jgi:hypothetical protein
VPPNALQEYRTRLDARRATRDGLTRTDARLAHARLAAFFSAVVLASLAWREAIGFWWLLAPAAIFLWLVRYHDRILETRELAIRGIGFYERGLTRLDDRWIGTGEPGERFRDDSHVYANDLDLFGRGSLFELLSLARTGAGESTLAGWLTSAADAAEIRERQAAVEELTPALDLREQLRCRAPTYARASIPIGSSTGRVTDSSSNGPASRDWDLHGRHAREHHLPGVHVSVVAALDDAGAAHGGASPVSQADRCDG